MTTDELVRALRADLVPVERPSRVEARALRFCLAALGFVAVCLAVHGLRPDWMQKLGEAAFVREQAALLGLFGLSAWSSFHLSVPGKSGALLARALPLLALVAWVALVFEHPPDGHGLGPPGVKCAARMVGLSVFPLVALVVGLRREPLLEPGQSGAFALFAACSLAMFGTQWLCTRSAPLHVLVWHCGPVALAGLAGFGVGVFRGKIRAKRATWPTPRK